MKKQCIMLFILFITIFTMHAMDDSFATFSYERDVFDTHKQLLLLYSMMQGTYIPNAIGLMINDDDETYTIPFSDVHALISRIDAAMSKHNSHERRLHSLMKHSLLLFPKFNMLLKTEKREPIITSNAAVSEVLAYLRYLQNEEAKLRPILTLFFECADASFTDQKPSGNNEQKDRSPRYRNLAKQYGIYDLKLGKLLALGKLKRIQNLEGEWKQRYSADIVGCVEQLIPIMHLCSFDDRAQIERDIHHALKTSHEIEMPNEKTITTSETEQIRAVLRIADIQIS